MPFVNIRILKGHSQQRKDEMSQAHHGCHQRDRRIAKGSHLGGVRGCHCRRLVCRRSARQRASEGGSGRESRDMSVEIRHPAFESVVGASVEFEKLGTGFLFTEGPLWNAAGQYLLFSDMPGDRITPLVGRYRCRRVQEPEQQVERPDLGPRRQAARLRTRDEPRDTHGAGWAHHRAGQSLRRQGAEQSQRYRGEAGRRDLLLRSDLWPDRVLRRAAADRTRFSRRLPARSRHEGIDPARRRLQAAERALLLARRETSVRQRHRTRSHPHVRRSARRNAGLAAESGRKPRARVRARPMA